MLRDDDDNDDDNAVVVANRLTVNLSCCGGDVGRYRLHRYVGNVVFWWSRQECGFTQAQASIGWRER